MPTTSWDALNKSAGVTLSGSNQIATFSTATLQQVAANRNVTGPTYFEIVATTMSGIVSIGLGDRTSLFSGSAQLGTDTHSVGYRSGGTVVINAATIATIQTFTQGDRIQVAFDDRVQPEQIWFNVNNGNWNNNAANNPATGVGGISLATLATPGPLLPAASCAATTPAAVLTASFTTFTFTAPSGFVTPDTCGATGYNADTNKGASFTSDGPVRQDPVSGSEFRSTMPVAAGGWYGGRYGATRLYPQWSPAATAKTITGTVTQGGAPVAAIVQLYNKATGDFITQTVSSAIDGSYSFADLNPAITYAVVAHDLPNFDALIHDNVAPA